jgi:rhodanese-related sulfurtransferase
MTAVALQEIDAETVKNWLDADQVELIDVRETGEHRRERIPGARILPLSQFDPAKLQAANGKRVVLHCNSGNRSAQAAKLLLQAGATEVAHLTGGIIAWRRAGFPVEKDKAAPLPIMRQVQIVVGTLVVLGVLLGFLAHPGFLGLSAFVGAGLLLAGVTGNCMLANLLARLPYNRV